MSSDNKSIREWLYNKLHITHRPVVKVYNGYGDEDMLFIYGHVLRQSPLPKTKFKKNFWSNSLSLLRLFMIEPYKDAKVKMTWGKQELEATCDQDGFFKFEWKSDEKLIPDWHEVIVTLSTGKYKGVQGKGRILIRHPTQYAFISDLDDTFLISHSANLRKRLYVLLTKNARTRRPFEGAAEHYRLLAYGNTTLEAPNPFFYVSSSEWNLYDYILEFKRSYGIPEGVYLLNQIKEGFEFLKTGQSNHDGKFMRIARVLKEFPHQKFILLGYDTQRDPYIYRKIVESFPDRILCVYLRHVGKNKKPEVIHLSKEIGAHGIEVCYFNKSEEAIEHSKRIGLIEDGKKNNEGRTIIHDGSRRSGAA